MKSLKYYVYISENKIEMLYSQLPKKFLAGVTAELKVNFGVASSSLTQKSSAETIYSKLEAVVSYLHKYESIGTIDDPTNYFCGTGSVRWGIFDHKGALVLFTGTTNRTVFGLGGSSSHLLGAKPTTDALYISTTPFLVEVLCEELQVKALTENYKDSIDVLVKNGRDRGEMALWAVEHANKFIDAPQQKVEFLAKRLLYQEANAAHEKNTLLATPLYVALAE